MAKERAARRAERERQAAQRAEQRAAEQARAARRRDRRNAFLRFVPRRRPVTGPLAARRRAQNRAALGLAVVVQVFAWLAVGSIRFSIAVLVFTVLALPAVLTVAFDRRS